MPHDDADRQLTEHAAGLHTSAPPGEDVSALVARAMRARETDSLMVRAKAAARTTSDRQVVALASAYLDGDVERVDALARDHLADHPDSVLVAWITARSNHLDRTRKDRT